MISCMRNVIPVYIFILAVVGLMLIPSPNDTAHAQCAVQICKSAPELSEGDVVFFPFQISEGDFEEFIEVAANSECRGDAFSGDDYQIREEPLPGWALDNVECSDSALIDVTIIEDGVSLDCLGGTEITCTFTNIRAVTSNVPTLSEWGMIAAAAGLALIGVFFAVRRRRLQGT